MFAIADLEGVLGLPLRQCPCFSVVLEATHTANQAPLKSAPCQLKKAIQRYGTEMRELLGGTEEKSVSRMRVIALATLHLSHILITIAIFSIETITWHIIREERTSTFHFQLAALSYVLSDPLEYLTTWLTFSL